MSASLSDQGTFKTIHLAYAPNQGAPYTGEKIGAVVHGTMHGYGTFPEFYAPVLPSTSLVPSRVSGSADPSYTWPQLFFPAGTTLTGLNKANLILPHGRHYPKLQQNWSTPTLTAAGSSPRRADHQMTARRGGSGSIPLGIGAILARGAGSGAAAASRGLLDPHQRCPLSSRARTCWRSASSRP